MRGDNRADQRLRVIRLHGKCPISPPDEPNSDIVVAMCGVDVLIARLVGRNQKNPLQLYQDLY